ncbi:ABC transporter ATP-binding protein [Mesoplasma tabanidae]|uniref:sn-glycerol-3-phosphate ABC transporter ATP-binding protein n=1 Tax=Mesoplasma tabanidae TaxID=219745 RepID=A0A2K8P395_9MOLU|nr:ABC transporter ATP-binding protein [Mesoplasma tabanidae]ATZ21231.1 sn-glycerol-3-phosphate ABC transporter ATP-binding protein [Mesoplasma tabanidae]
MSIKLKNITIDYGNFLAVNDLSVNINKGELVSLLGPSGCGKTTALNAIAGLINTTSGQILFDGVDVTHKTPQQRNIGLVFQSYALYSHMSVFKNIAYPLYHSKDFKKELARDNFKYKNRLNDLKQTKAFELVIKQQNDFLNDLKSFLKETNYKFKLLETEFLKNHKNSIVEYTDQLFADFENAEVLKNHLVSYLYDKLKIKFNEIKARLESVILRNYKALLVQKLDVRFAGTIGYYAWLNEKNVKDNQKHLVELIKTSKTSKKQIRKEQKKVSSELDIFNGSSSQNGYETYNQTKTAITNDFIDLQVSELEREIDVYFAEVLIKTKTPIIENSKIEAAVILISKKIETFRVAYLNKHAKLNEKFVKKVLKKLPSEINIQNDLTKYFMNISKMEFNNIERKLNELVFISMQNFVNSAEQSEFTQLTNYYSVNMNEHLNNSESSEQLLKINKEIEKIVSLQEGKNADGVDILNIQNADFANFMNEREALTESLLIVYAEKTESFISETFVKLPLLVATELEKNSVKIDTKEIEQEIRKNIYSKKRKIRTLVLEAAKQVEIESQLNKKPSELSGGQQQRVAIARAVVKKPSILLMDEPLSNLDAKLRLTTREWIKRFQQKVGITTVFVTHDQEEAMSMSDSIFVMNKGVLQQSGTPLEIYNKPKNKFVANFIGTPNINFIDVKVKKSTFELPSGDKLTIKGEKIEKEQWTLGIRPERISISGTKGKIFIGEGEVSLVEQLGKQNHIKVRLENELEITLILEPHEWNNLKDSSTLKLYARKEDLYLFDAETNLVEVKYA